MHSWLQLVSLIICNVVKQFYDLKCNINTSLSNSQFVLFKYSSEIIVNFFDQEMLPFTEKNTLLFNIDYVMETAAAGNDGIYRKSETCSEEKGQVLLERPNNHLCKKKF